MSFENFSLIKPFSSRPANSERYLDLTFSLASSAYLITGLIYRYVVCLNMRPRNDGVIRLLQEVNAQFDNLQDGSDIDSFLRSEADELNDRLMTHVRDFNLQ